jgi:acyl-CoA dehydrogenase
MDFEDSPEEAAFRAEARGFLEAHASLRTGTDADWSRGPYAMPGADEARQLDYLKRCREWAATLYDNGWAGLTWPKEWGGRGATPGESIIFGQEAAEFDVTTGWVGAAQQLVGPALIKHGTPEQKERYVRPMLRGDELWCQLFSEPGAGSDLASLRTKAELDGDEWVVNGQKVWTSSAQHADFGILICRTDPDAPKNKGVTYFVVDMKTPGIDVRPLVQATGLSHFNEVFLTDVRLPATNLVGEVNEGWQAARTTLRSESAMISGAGAGMGSDQMINLARVHGVSDDLVVRQGLADVYTREQIMRYLQYRMQTAITRRNTVPPDPSILKNFYTQSLARKVDLALEIEGPGGMLWDYDAFSDGFWQRQVLAQFASRIGGGTNEVHRNMIGERALGLPREPDPWHDQPWSDVPRS